MRQGQQLNQPNQPSRAPYKPPMQPNPQADAGSSNTARRRPPIGAGAGGGGGVGRGLPTMGGGVTAVSGPSMQGGYSGQRPPNQPQVQPLVTAQPVLSQPAYPFPLLHGAPASIGQTYPMVQAMPMQPQVPLQQTRQPAMQPIVPTNVTTATNPTIAGRKPPVPRAQPQPLTSQFGTVENKQTLKMPVNVPIAPQNVPVNLQGPQFVPRTLPQQIPVTTQMQPQPVHTGQAPVFGAAPVFPASKPQEHQHPHPHPHPTATHASQLPASTTTASTQASKGQATKGPPVAKNAPATSTTGPTSSASAVTSNLASNVVKSQPKQEEQTTSSAKAATTGPQLTASKKPATTQPKPWTQFTGTERKDPILANWVTVRQVVSADTFRLASIKPANQQFTAPKLINFTLEGIRTPWVARNIKNTDLPYGYEAREFVRKHLCTGAPVLCAAWNVNKEGKLPRYFGDIYFSPEGKGSADGKSNKESLRYLLVANGYADLPPKEKSQLSATEYDRLAKALEKAKKMNLGKFADGGASANTEEDKKKQPSGEKEGKKKGGKGQTQGQQQNQQQKKQLTPQQLAHTRKLVWVQSPEERRKIFNKYHNKEIPAIVEQVWSGSTLRVELIPNENDFTHELVTINLAGCTAPRPPSKKGDKGNKNRNTTAANWSSEAREFTEERLLSQRVSVKILATDPKNNLYAVISHPKGQIAVSLLRTGLAEFETWTAQLLDPKDQKDMKEALKSAQTKCLHIWQDKKPNTASQEFVPATVTQILSGDTFIARVNGKEERFTLSSIRQPRFKTQVSPRKNESDKEDKEEKEEKGDKDNKGGKSEKGKGKKGDKDNKGGKDEKAGKGEKGGKGGKGAKDEKAGKEEKTEKGGKGKGEKAGKNEKGGKGKNKDKDNKDNKNVQSSQYAEHPWVRPAKEFLRQKMIGKEVQLMVDYEKESKNVIMIHKGLTIQKFATVLVDKKNVAVELVREGLAEVIQHKQEDPKSMAYLELQKAEEKAKAAKKGIHGNQQPEEIIDYSTGSYAIKPSNLIEMSNQLKGQKRKAVIEYVFSGQRLKVYLPDMKCFLPLGLAYVRCDRYNLRAKDAQTKFGRAAYDFVKGFWQRDAEIEVTDVVEQKGGSQTWFGKVWVGGKDLGLELLKKGFAQVATPRAAPVQRGGKPAAALTVPNAYTKAEAQAREQQLGWWADVIAREKQIEERSMTGKEEKVVVSQIDSAVDFWVNVAKNNELENLEEKMSRVRPRRAGKITIKKIVAVLYDGLYCRARVVARDTRNDYSWIVVFVDYGNRARVSEENMIALPQELNLRAQPPLAQRCQLAALLSPPRFSSFFNISGEHFARLVLPDPSGPSNGAVEKAAPAVKEWKIKVLWDDQRRRKWHVVLTDQTTNANEQMLKEGYARFDKKKRVEELFARNDDTTKEYLRVAKKLNDEAVQARRGMWESGEIESDEEEQL